MTAASRVADALLALLVAGLFALTAMPHVAPQFGVDPLVIRGRSMAPTIPIGAVVFAREVEPTELRVGDVVTIRADNNVLYTHRVVEVVAGSGGLAFRTQGDANESADASLAPGRAIVGRVDGHVPVLGYLVVLATRPSGMVSAFALGVFLFAFGRLADGMRRRHESSASDASDATEVSNAAQVAQRLRGPVGAGR